MHIKTHKKYILSNQSKNGTIYRYTNLQELNSINSSTNQFTPNHCTKSNTAVSTTKCRYLALHQYIVTQTATQRYLPQNTVTLHYNNILLHKHQHSGPYNKLPLPCTTTVYCYTNTNTAVPTKFAVTLHYNSILLHKHQHSGTYKILPLPCTTPVYCYTNTNTAVPTKFAVTLH